MTVSFRDFYNATTVDPASAGPVEPSRPYADGAKRVLDVLAVLAGAVVVLPVVAILALLVARDGHSPFYGQKRVGRGGRAFLMWKLRTMVPDAEARLADHLAADPAARAEWDRAQKLRADPRITAVGRILRKTSLDELPQLWNVLRGEMSLVGPRPMMLDQRAIYPGTEYYLFRPGITGYWQVSDRNDCTFADRARFDARYAETISLATDLSILLRTVLVVIRGTGH